MRGLAVVAVGGEFAFEKPAAEVAEMLARAEGTGGVGMMERDAVKFLVKLSSWAERVQRHLLRAELEEAAGE